MKIASNRQAFLKTWFEEAEGNIEIRILPEKKQGFFAIDDIQGLENFVSNYQDKTNVFFGIATRNGNRGTKANIINIPGVWADIDILSKAHPNGIPRDKADKLLRECPINPTFVIESGNGYQGYWKFKEPTDNIDIIEYTNHQLMDYFGSDNVRNADRIFRLPDTINWKDRKNPVDVKVIMSNPGLAYNESHFEELLPPVKNATSAKKISNPPGWQNELLKGVGKGKRHDAMKSLIGRYIAKSLADEEILPLVQAIDVKNNPPLAEEENLLTFIQSIRRTHNRNHPPQEDPLKFPDIIGGVAGDFAKLFSANLEVPEHFLYMAFFACLGSILSKSLKLNTELDIEARLYLLLLGESADDRKSTSIKKTVQFFKEILKQDFYVCWGANSAEGLQKMFKKNSTLLMAVDELKALLSKCKIEGSTLLPMITTLFESDTFEAHTKTSDILIDDASFSLLAASTIETYETVWDSSFTAIGFNNRLWILPGEAKRRFSLPVKISEERKDLVKQETLKILRLVGNGLELDITQEGKELFQDWYMNLDKSVHAKRLDGYALRFMALMAVNDLKDEIDLEIVKKAIALADWQLQVRQVYDPIDADNTIAAMEERIRRYLKQEPLPERDLKRKLHRVIERSGIWCFTTAIKNLRIAKDIYFKKGVEERTVHIYLSE